MNIFNFTKKEKTATKAFDRLTLIIKRDRESNSMPYLENLKKDILAVLNKYTEGGNVNIKSDNNSSSDLIELEVKIPSINSNE
jgi:cell division topological specificity factor